MQDNTESGFFSVIGRWWVNYVKALGLAFRGMGRDNISMMASGLVYSMLGIPQELFTPVFALARIVPSSPVIT